MINKQREYEIMFLLNQNENIHSHSLEKIKETLSSKNVTIISEEKIGIKKLAYPVKKNNEGYYHLFYINAETSAMKELEKEFKLFEDILKYLVVKKETKKKGK